jgi:hypothetical protein
MDRTFKPSKNISKFERYDHLITGWARLKDRYAKYLNTLPLIVFVCRDEDSAREFCRAADPVVRVGCGRKPPSRTGGLTSRPSAGADRARLDATSGRRAHALARSSLAAVRA